MKAEDQLHKDMAISFLRLVASGKVRDAYDRYIEKHFRHHNAFFRGDRESLLKAMEENADRSPDKLLDVKHVLADGNFVAVHSHIRQHPEDLGGAVIHLFRFENDRIAELWDVGQAVPPESPNEYGMF